MFSALFWIIVTAAVVCIIAYKAPSWFQKSLEDAADVVNKGVDESREAVKKKVDELRTK